MADRDFSESSDDESEKEDFGDFTEDEADRNVDNEFDDDQSSLKGEDSDSKTPPKSARKDAKNNKKSTKVTKKVVTRKQKIIMNVYDTQYDVIKYVGKKLFKWKLSYDPEVEWDITWTDNAVQPETLARMQPFQKINHFPGMYSIARKNNLGRNLMRMRKAFPDSFKFFPPTWLLPSEFGDFRAQFTKNGKKTFIIKPAASCQGRGIFLTRTWENVSMDEQLVAQRYLEKPYLIDGLKFDLRLYVLLAGCDPLKIFLYHDGLARFATEEYIAPSADNIENVCMHLTNYAINKENPNFIFNDDAEEADVGHKRSVVSVFKLLEEQGHDVNKLWAEIKKLIIKTFCSIQPILSHYYRSSHPDEPYNNMCFEVLGFDVMLDHKLKPWLIEVNHTPSFTTDTPFDRKIKKNVVRDTLKLMNISLKSRLKYKEKRRVEMQARMLTGKKVKMTPEEKAKLFADAQKERDLWEQKHPGGFTKIYPFDNPEDSPEPYEAFIKEANKWWEEWTGTSIRRNTKKTTDKKEPPPFVFSLPGTNYGRRGKEPPQDTRFQKPKPVQRQISQSQDPKPATSDANSVPRNSSQKTLTQGKPDEKNIDVMASQPDLCLESQEVQKENFYDPREEQLIAEDGINEDGQLMETARANEQENLFKISSYNPPTHLNELEENYKIIREKEMLSRETSPKRFDNQKLSNGKIMPYAIRKNSHPNTQLSSLPPINQGKNEPPKDQGNLDRVKRTAASVEASLREVFSRESNYNPIGFMVEGGGISGAVKAYPPNKTGTVAVNQIGFRPAIIEEVKRSPVVVMRETRFQPKKSSSPARGRNYGAFLQPKLLEFNNFGLVKSDNDMRSKVNSRQNLRQVMVKGNSISQGNSIPVNTFTGDNMFFQPYPNLNQMQEGSFNFQRFASHVASRYNSGVGKL